MIVSVFQSGRYMQVTGGSSSTYVNNYSGAQGVGNMRYNTSSQNIEVFDGSNWQPINMGAVSVGLNSEAEQLLDWAREQRNQQLAYESMAKDNPAIKNALDNLKRAEQQLDLVYKLSKDYEDDGVLTSS